MKLKSVKNKVYNDTVDYVAVHVEDKNLVDLGVWYKIASDVWDEVEFQIDAEIYNRIVRSLRDSL